MTLLGLRHPDARAAATALPRALSAHEHPLTSAHPHVPAALSTSNDVTGLALEVLGSARAPGPSTEDLSSGDIPLPPTD